MTFNHTVEDVGKVVDAAGVAVIVSGIAAAVVCTTVECRFAAGMYRLLRQRVGKAILLGLELLVAADIIRTVAVTPTLESAAVLALIVVIRTSLSFSLEVELEGRWPWNRGRASDATPSSLPPQKRPTEKALTSGADSAHDRSTP